MRHSKMGNMVRRHVWKRDLNFAADTPRWMNVPVPDAEKVSFFLDSEPHKMEIEAKNNPVPRYRWVGKISFEQEAKLHVIRLHIL
jgi:hypothetical protein